MVLLIAMLLRLVWCYLALMAGALKRAWWQACVPVPQPLSCCPYQECADILKAGRQNVSGAFLNLQLLCVLCATCSWLCRAASQLGDNYSLIKGPGLAAGSTVSSYLESVRRASCQAPVPASCTHHMQL